MGCTPSPAHPRLLPRSMIVPAAKAAQHTLVQQSTAPGPRLAAVVARRGVAQGAAWPWVEPHIGLAKQDLKEVRKFG